MPEKILVIDDDVSITEMLDFALKEAGFEVRAVHSGLAGLHELFEDPPDLVILDVLMPKMDGWEVCHRIREVSNVPILMLTALGEEADKLRGLHGGADVYMVKPFEVQVLIAQVEAMLRRAGSTGSPQPKRLIAGDLEIDLARREALLEGEPLNLTPLEFRVLATLASRAGEVVPSRELLAQVWGPQYADESVYLKLYVFYLRQKIEKDSHCPQYILTKRGEGYYLNAESVEVSTA